MVKSNNAVFVAIHPAAYRSGGFLAHGALKENPKIIEITGILDTSGMDETEELNEHESIIYGWRHSISFYIGLPRFINHLGRTFEFHIYDDEHFENEVTHQIDSLGKEMFIGQYIKSHSSPKKNGSFKYTFKKE